MRIGITATHFMDANMNPAGGSTFGKGFAIAWQNGPLGRGEKRIEPNGSFVEDIIDAARDRLQFYQNSKFECKENEVAIEHLKLALSILDTRTKSREKRGVEGTHEI